MLTGLLDTVRFLLIASAVYGLTRILAHPRNPWRILDVPNERSLHATPVPRTGGLAILAGLSLALALFVPRVSVHDAVIGLAVGAVAVISWRDDRVSLSPAIRLMAQIMAAMAAVIWGGAHWAGPVLPGVALTLPPAVRDALSVFYLVWCMNLYNFMDGMDGLAGGMAVIGFGALALLAARAGAAAFAMTGGAISMAALGFTVSNYPPARLFMGDAGSVPLGFLVGVMTLTATSDIAPLWAGILIFAPFFADASVTLVRRLVRGENPARAHRQHYYQRLVLGGLSPKRVIWYEYALMGSCAASAWWAVDGPPRVQWAIIAAWTGIYAALATLIDRRQGRG
ncbi:MAG: glycosyl transferase [Gammaproteobacteria bacterium]|nr:glycosyl transferase [Gammaproteobacteria bacterium]